MFFDGKCLVLTLFGLLITACAQAEYLVAMADVENIRDRRAAVADKSLSPLIRKIGETRFTLSGLIEVEASLVHAEGDDQEDDLRLSTLQIGLEAEFTPLLGGHIIGLWEEDSTEPMAVDEAVISLTSPWQPGNRTPVLHIGRQYLPFGKFESGMISDPLTLELGETHSTAALLALSGERWSVSLGTFVGSTDNGDADRLDSWLLAIEATPREGVTVGASWISDLAESDAELVQNEGLYRDEVPGWSAFVALHHGPYGLMAEYLTAAKSFKSEQVENGEDLTGRRPDAWNLELTWQPVDRVQLAVRYEAAHDYQDDISRYGTTLSYGLCDFALLAFEYLHADAEQAPPAHSFTAQLAVEF